MPARTGKSAATAAVFASRSVLALLCAGLVAAGCGSGDAASGGLSVAVTPSTVAPGGEIAARVVNHTDQEFTYGAGYELEREVGDGFEPVKLPRRAVIQIAYIAKPGEQGPAVAATVPDSAAPGRWRVVIQRNVPDSGDLTGEFEVTGG